jgi:hypothetical protein
VYLAWLVVLLLVATVLSWHPAKLMLRRWMAPGAGRAAIALCTTATLLPKPLVLQSPGQVPTLLTSSADCCSCSRELEQGMVHERALTRPVLLLLFSGCPRPCWLQMSLQQTTAVYLLGCRLLQQQC